ncbi:MAG: sulfatase-like hydrolase/transferase [Halioglobus sp.]
MKKIMVFVLIAALMGAGAWLNRGEIMLAVIKYKSANEYEIAQTKDLPWQAGPEQAEVPLAQRPPNIILIVADDLGYNDISTFGGGVSGASDAHGGSGGHLQTPGIDSLAAAGAVFTQSYSGASTCAPSRGMMMTGRYPTRTGFEFTPTPGGMGKMVSSLSASMDSDRPPGVYDEAKEAGQPPYEMKGLPASEVTIAEVLKEKGYYTAHIGKWHLGRNNGMAAHQQGFDDSLLMASGLYLPEDDPNVVNAKLAFDPIDRFLWARMVYANSFNSGDEDRFEPGGYLTDYWTDESIKIIKANKNRPFFLYLAHWGTHTPLQATREDYDAVGDIQPHRKRVYAAMVRSLDRSVQRILDTLEEQGLTDNTIVMFTSDNGGPGYIGIDDVNSPYRGWKITMFEGGIRVPTFVKWPAKIPAGTTVEKPVAHIDVMPTLAAAAGAAPPAGVAIDGVNLLPLATGRAAGSDAAARETLFWHNGHYQVVRHGDWKLQVNDRPTDGLQTWLFNLADDPTEQINLAASREDKVAQLNALLAAHKANSRGPLYESTTQMPVLIDKTLAEKYVDGDEYVYTPN